MGKGSTRLQELETLSLLSLVLILMNIATGNLIFLYAAVLLLVTALFIKPVAGLITIAWLKIAEILAVLNSKIILTLLFYVVLTPLALVYRVFHKDSLRLNADSSSTLYSERNHTFCKGDLEKMW